MRFTHKPYWPEDLATYKTDRTGLMDGKPIGRIYMQTGGLSAGLWSWFDGAAGNPPSGIEDTPEEALATL